MAITTRRLTQTELDRLKQMQGHLEQLGIRVTLSELGESVTSYVTEHFEDFVQRLKESSHTSSVDPLITWLETITDGKEPSEAVTEHDVAL
ncbi:MAG TPA: hypothetical protein VJ044_02885 [Candidatus Hodarchaeales archaeon]|nr:hypothetical protein [Candidatus Hodarchaeales archaeon]